MARARNIKPGLFKNEILGVADPLLTILFEALWCIADKAGRLEDRPLRIKAEAFPYRDGLDVNRYLTELQRMGFIYRYVVDNQALIQVVNFLKHQNPHKTEKDSELPEILLNSDSCMLTVNDTLKNGSRPADSLIPDSLIPDSGLIDSPPQAAVPAKPKRTKSQKIPLPDGFTVSDAIRIWAAEKKFDQIDQHFESFISKVKANGYTYVDWDAAFRNAVSDDWAKVRQNVQKTQYPAKPEKFDPLAYVNRAREVPNVRPERDITGEVLEMVRSPSGIESFPDGPPLQST